MTENDQYLAFFNKYDKNGDGVLQRNEWKQLCLDLIGPDSIVKDKIQYLDNKPVEPEHMLEYLELMFDQVDTDNSGSISPKELLAWLQSNDYEAFQRDMDVERADSSPNLYGHSGTSSSSSDLHKSHTNHHRKSRAKHAAGKMGHYAWKGTCYAGIGLGIALVTVVAVPVAVGVGGVILVGAVLI